MRKEASCEGNPTVSYLCLDCSSSCSLAFHLANADCGPCGASVCAVVPIHYTQRVGVDPNTVNKSQLMQLTVAALPQGSNVMWYVVLANKIHQTLLIRLAIAHHSTQEV